MEYTHPRHGQERTGKMIVRPLYRRAKRMKGLVQKAAWTFIISGIISLLFGILTFSWPGITLVVLVWLFAIPLLLQGIIQTITAIKNRRDEYYWWVFLLWGVVNCIAAIAVIMYPGITAMFLIILMGIAWIGAGITLIMAAVRLRKQINNEGWLLLGGIISIVAGLYVIINPGAGALSVIWVIALYACLFGITLIAIGWRARTWGESYFEELMD